MKIPASKAEIHQVSPKTTQGNVLKNGYVVMVKCWHFMEDVSINKSA
jgi:predicted ribonuclease toxin of YeeF-YezG toxin-antitoxin module